MNSKKLGIVLIFLMISTFLLNISTIIVKADNNYEISINDTDYKYIKKIKKGSFTFEYFDISVTLYNSGPDTSDDMTVNLIDEDGSYNLTGTLAPGEEKTFTFDNHPLIGQGNHNIKINFFPTDVNNRRVKNTGSTTLKISRDKKENNNSVPGFELILLFLSIVIFYLIIYKKNNN